MTEFENNENLVEEVAQAAEAPAEPVVEAAPVEEVVADALDEVADAIKEVIEPEPSVEAPAEPAAEVAADPEPAPAASLDDVTNAAVNFVMQTDSYATDYLKETMPDAVPEEAPVQPATESAAFAAAQAAAASVGAAVAAGTEAAYIPQPGPVSRPGLGPKPEIDWNPVTPEQVDVAPGAQTPGAGSFAQQPQPAAPQSPNQQFQQYQQQNAQRGAQMNQQFQQYQQRAAQQAAQMGANAANGRAPYGNQPAGQPGFGSGSPVGSQNAAGASAGGFSTGYEGGADKAWQNQPNNIEAKPNPSYAGPKNPSELQNNPYTANSAASGSFATGYTPDQSGIPGRNAQPAGQSSFSQFQPGGPGNMGPQNPSETQNSPYTNTASSGGFATGYTGGAANAWQNQQGAQSPYGQPNYGQRAYQQPQQGTTQDPGYTMSIISMICGIVSCVMFWGRIGGFLSIACGIAAVILGILSGKKSLDGKRNGMALAGLITGIIGIALSIISIACWACACSAIGAGLGDLFYEFY